MSKSYKIPSALSYIASGLVGAAAAHSLRGRSSEKPIVPCFPDIRPILETILKEGKENAFGDSNSLLENFDKVARYLSEVAIYKTALVIADEDFLPENPRFYGYWGEIINHLNEMKSRYSSTNFSAVEKFLKEAQAEYKALNPPVRVAMRSPKRKTAKSTRRKVVKSLVKRSRAIVKRSRASKPKRTPRKSSKQRARTPSRRP